MPGLLELVWLSPLRLLVLAVPCWIGYRILLYIYRLTFHPLAKYPGPFFGRISHGYAAYLSICGNYHLGLEQCHQKYGPIVRISPNKILFNTPKALQDIYGVNRNVKKAETYIIHGDGNILGIRDKAEYARKKKIFSQGFTDANVREHEPKIMRWVDVFCSKLCESADTSKPVDSWADSKDTHLWTSYLTIDISSDLIFSAPLGLLNFQKNTHVVKVLDTIMVGIGVSHQLPIFINKINLRIAQIRRHLNLPSDIRKIAMQLIKTRNEAEARTPNLKDVYGMQLAAKDLDGADALRTEEVTINSINLIVAASETTSSVIAATMFYLAHDPRAYAKVANEVRSTFPTFASIHGGNALASCVYLRAAIDETMRMSTPSPVPLFREVERGGITIDGEFVPAGSIVGVGTYSLHHNEKFVPDSYTFDIERWIPQPGNENEDEFRALQRSFAPFSYGVRMCLARNLATNLTMLTLASIFVRMDFRLADGEEGLQGMGGRGEWAGQWGRHRENELQTKTSLSMRFHGPMLTFKPRKVQVDSL